MSLVKDESLGDRMTRKEAAAYLGVAPSTLAVWGCTKRYKLPFIKVGSIVQYWRKDLDIFLNERTLH